MPAKDTSEFVDTNVLLYAYDSAAGERHARAAKLIGELGATRRGAISVQVLQEFYVNVTRKIAKPLAHDTAVERIRLLSRWPLHVPGAGDVIAAAELSDSARMSFWDAMIIVSAQALRCETLWSEDLNASQQVGSVTIRNPFQDAP